MTIGDRIRSLRKDRGMSQEDLAKLLGYTSRSTINKIEMGINDLTQSKIEAFSRALNVSPAYLLGFDFDDDCALKAPPSLTPKETTHISKYRACDERGKGIVDNVLDYEYARVNNSDPVPPLESSPRELDIYIQPTAAGLGNYLDDPYSTTIELPAAKIPYGTTYGVRVSGNSMEPDIPDGCIAFVQSCPAIESGEIGVFSLNGESYCKKLCVDRNAQEIRLESINPEYDPIIVTPEDYLHTYGLVLGTYVEQE